MDNQAYTSAIGGAPWWSGAATSYGEGRCTAKASLELDKIGVRQNDGIKRDIANEGRHFDNRISQEALRADNKFDNQTATLMASITDAKSVSNSNFVRIGSEIAGINNRLCGVEKDAAVAAALASERDKLTQFKLDSILSRTATNDVINSQLAKFQSITGCQPAVSPCGG